MGSGLCDSERVAVRDQEDGAAPLTASDPPRQNRRLGPLSGVARRGKLKFFLPRLDKEARILDLGCGDNWFKVQAAERGWANVVGIDLAPPADIVGDVFQWQRLGLEPHSFDAIIAFEVMEHGDFTGPILDLLKANGQLMATTPVPGVDPLLKVLEGLWLLQKRSSPHTHLTDLRRLEEFDVTDWRVKAGVSQWAVLHPSRGD
jgi:2-polyprenyl-3-methyl-5-hydroxy-6-metoxy-1,4-benzoquinol methylase